MAELFVDAEELEALLLQADLPFTIHYQNGQIVISGRVEKMLGLRYQAMAEFRKLSDDHLTLEVVETKPSVGPIDDWVKSKLFQFLDENEKLPANFYYPYISIDLRAISGWDLLKNWVTITGMDFESDGIRVRFVTKTDELINDSVA